MTERTQSKIKFVGLHAHSVAGSIFDGLGFPQEHMEFAYSNGSDALALTDHGNMNGLSYQVLHAKKMKAEGKTSSLSLVARLTSSLQLRSGEKNTIRQCLTRRRHEQQRRLVRQVPQLRTKGRARARAAMFYAAAATLFYWHRIRLV